MVDGKRAIRVLIVEDEAFTRTIVGELLDASGIEVNTVKSVSEALAVMEKFDPHVVVTDLDLGKGPDGADLLTKVAAERPWTGMVVMTAHASPHLAIADASRIPQGSVYVVKSQITSREKLLAAIDESIEAMGFFDEVQIDTNDKITITANQAEILKMLSEGLSNSAIADARNISLRAAEALIQRTFAALGVNNDAKINARVAAVKLWHQGKVIVK